MEMKIEEESIMVDDGPLFQEFLQFKRKMKNLPEGVLDKSLDEIIARRLQERAQEGEGNDEGIQEEDALAAEEQGIPTALEACPLVDKKHKMPVPTRSKVAQHLGSLAAAQKRKLAVEINRRGLNKAKPKFKKMQKRKWSSLRLGRLERTVNRIVNYLHDQGNLVEGKSQSAGVKEPEVKKHLESQPRSTSFFPSRPPSLDVSSNSLLNLRMQNPGGPSPGAFSIPGAHPGWDMPREIGWNSGKGKGFGTSFPNRGLGKGSGRIGGKGYSGSYPHWGNGKGKGKGADPPSKFAQVKQILSRQDWGAAPEGFPPEDSPLHPVPSANSPPLPRTRPLGHADGSANPVALHCRHGGWDGHYFLDTSIASQICRWAGVKKIDLDFSETARAPRHPCFGARGKKLLECVGMERVHGG